MTEKVLTFTSTVKITQHTLCCKQNKKEVLGARILGSPGSLTQFTHHILDYTADRL